MNEQHVLSKEEILAAEDLPLQEYYVEEWNGAIWLRTLTGIERDHFEARIAQSTGTRGMRSKFVTSIICDQNGTPLFKVGDCDALEKKSASALHGIMEAGLKHNKMTSEDIDETEKNSEGDPSDVSGFD